MAKYVSINEALSCVKSGDYIVTGLGSAEDVAGLDLVGKIAVISRGELTFAEKAANAFDAGAVAVIIYNNAAEEINMILTDLMGIYTAPCVMVTSLPA